MFFFNFHFSNYDQFFCSFYPKDIYLLLDPQPWVSASHQEYKNEALGMQVRICTPCTTANPALRRQEEEDFKFEKDCLKK